MILPSKTQRLCNKYLEMAQTNALHNVNPADRFRLYESFGPSRLLLPKYSKRGGDYDVQEYHNLLKDEFLSFTIADFTLAWLAYLTAKYVLPNWERVWQQVPFRNINTPQEILYMAESVLQHTLSFDYVSNQLSDFNTAQTISLWTTYEIGRTFDAAYYALELIIHGARNLGESYPDDDIEINTRDFASEAVKAYTTIDPNNPGEWKFSYNTVKFDLQKRLEFWEWWLTEAIPQAWELAQETVF